MSENSMGCIKMHFWIVHTERIKDKNYFQGLWFIKRNAIYKLICIKWYLLNRLNNLHKKYAKSKMNILRNLCIELNTKDALIRIQNIECHPQNVMCNAFIKMKFRESNAYNEKYCM